MEDRGTKDGTLWYYRALVDALREHGAPVNLIEELDRVVVTMEELARQEST